MLFCASMSVPSNLLRNLRHPATPRRTPFDDHEVSVLASLFIKFQDLYTVDKDRVARAVYSAVVTEWHKESGKLSYNQEKQYRAQECITPTLQDVVDVFTTFERSSAEDLQTLDVHFAVGVNKRLLGESLGRVLEPSEPLQTPGQEHLVVKPKISGCIFCKNAPLQFILRKESCGGKAPGGNSWAYEFTSGARVAMVYQGICEQCKSVYSLQTYTPGTGIMANTGSTQHHYSKFDYSRL
jgi:hypothetical protein